MDNLDDIFNEEIEPKKPEKPHMFKGATVLIVIAIVIALAGVFVIGMVVGQSTYNGIDKDHPVVDEVYDLLKKHYYEDVTKEDFDKAFAQGITAGLDRYTGVYMEQVDINGEIGISLQYGINNEKTITHIKTGSPFSGDLCRADQIIGIKFKETDPWTDVEYMDDKRFNTLAKESISIAFKVRRAGKEVETTVQDKLAFVGDKVAHYLPTGESGIGYVRLDEFADDVAKNDFLEAVTSFVEDNNYIMILDLRGNPGGDAEELSYIVNNFVPHPTNRDLVIDIVGRNGGRSKYYAKEQYTMIDVDESSAIGVKNTYIGDKVKTKTGKDFKMVILANDMSASASEAFIGNIIHYMPKSDYLLLGEDDRTFGKGIAQSGFKLTTANYILQMTIGKYYVLGANGTDSEKDLTNIHGIGYELDTTGITKEIKGNVLEESAVKVGIERAKNTFMK